MFVNDQISITEIWIQRADMSVTVLCSTDVGNAGVLLIYAGAPGSQDEDELLSAGVVALTSLVGSTSSAETESDEMEENKLSEDSSGGAVNTN